MLTKISFVITVSSKQKVHFTCFTKNMSAPTLISSYAANSCWHTDQLQRPHRVKTGFKKIQPPPGGDIANQENTIHRACSIYIYIFSIMYYFYSMSLMLNAKCSMFSIHSTLHFIFTALMNALSSVSYMKDVNLTWHKILEPGCRDLEVSMK